MSSLAFLASAKIWHFLLIRIYQFHQISVLCYHQELACTPKDPPRRVDMNERSLICFYNELSTKPFENLLFWACWKTAYALLYHNIYPIYLYCLTIALLCTILCYLALFCSILLYFGKVWYHRRVPAEDI